MTNSARDLINIWRSLQPDSCAIEECPEDGNVYLTTTEGGDVYMCAAHATVELDKEVPKQTGT